MIDGPNTLLKLDSRGWHDQIARIISAEDTALFPAVLVEALRYIVPFDYSVFFAYRGQECPICVYVIVKVVRLLISLRSKETIFSK